MFEPETIILRLGQVIGKILEIISAYLPRGTLRGDKLALLVPPLSAALFLFFRSAWPIVKAQFVELDELDLAVYQLCFAPVGVKVVQFKAMKATGVCFNESIFGGLVHPTKARFPVGDSRGCVSCCFEVDEDFCHLCDQYPARQQAA